MHHNNDTFIQDIVEENEQIHRRISDELKKAASQVLVAMAWFTDPDLYQVLLDLANRRIDVRVIIADYEDNRKLPFDELRRAGAIIHKVTNNRYGGMRHRFCVVDKKLAIYGTYYWTVNARINNQESIMVTSHTATVASLIHQFEELETQFPPDRGRRWHRIIGLFTRPRSKPEEPVPAVAESMPAQEQPEQEKAAVFMADIQRFRAEYTDVLDHMIAAEIGAFDRELLRNQGEERAAVTNGDAQLLGNALDSVYAGFINDINMVADKKLRLIARVNEHRIIYDGQLELSYQAQLRQIESEAESTKRQTIIHAETLKAKTTICESDIELIRTQKIAAAEKQEQLLETQLRAIDQTNVRPSFKWHEFIPVLFMGGGLLIYLFLFYSSAAYILLYSERDAIEAQNKGIRYIPPQIFEARALSKILEEGTYAISFVFLFVFLPLALVATGRLAKHTFLGKIWLSFPLALLLDVGIAYKVAAAIYQAAYLIGDQSEPWHFSKVFSEPNFYLVFLLGSLGLFIFHALFHKFISLFEERSPDVAAKQLMLRKKQEQESLEKQRMQISMLHQSAENISQELIKVKHELHVAELKLADQPHQRASLLEKARYGLEQNRKVLHDVTAVYIARIENDRLPVSVHALKDRINIFLDGWTRFLNREYAEARAIERTAQAKAIATLWEEQCISQHFIDHRTKQLS